MEIIDINEIPEDNNDPLYIGTLVCVAAMTHCTYIKKNTNINFNDSFFIQAQTELLLLLASKCLQLYHDENRAAYIYHMIETGHFNYMLDALDGDEMLVIEYEAHLNKTLKEYASMRIDSMESLDNLFSSYNNKLIYILRIYAIESAKILPLLKESCIHFISTNIYHLK
jgi:hypothetical protein